MTRLEESDIKFRDYESKIQDLSDEVQDLEACKNEKVVRLLEQIPALLMQAITVKNDLAQG